MHVLAMRNYKALERTAEVFKKAQKPLSATNFKPLINDTYGAEKTTTMSAPVFAQFLRLFIG